MVVLLQEMVRFEPTTSGTLWNIRQELVAGYKAEELRLSGNWR